MAATYFKGVVPTTDPDLRLVETWLRENLQDGKWEYVRWYPAENFPKLRDANLLHIVESIENAKAAYERGAGGSTDLQAEFERHYSKFRKSEVRTFCAFKYRVTTQNGQGKMLETKVFEIVNGAAKLCPGNDIVEASSWPTDKPVYKPFSYPGMKFFEDADYDPFPPFPNNLDERAKVALEWKEPRVVAAIVREEPTPRQPSENTPVAANPFIAAAAAAPQVEAKPAGSIPPKIREYLDRETELRGTEVGKLEKRISDFQTRERSSKKIAEKNILNERIRQTEDQLAELKLKEFNALIPDKPDVGDVGALQTIEVVDAIDENTLLVRWLPNGKGRLPKLDIAIHPMSVSDIDIGDETVTADFFKVTATKSEPSDLWKKLKDSSKPVSFVVEPFDKTIVEKWRDKFEDEKKLKDSKAKDSKKNAVPDPPMFLK